MNEIYFTLANGVQIPALAYGTYKVTGANCKVPIRAALEAGYHHLDTATFYHNEKEIGEVIRETGIDRKDLWLTSKVWKSDMGYEKTRRAFLQTLEDLGTDYLDLYLVHWPRPDLTSDWKPLLLETWKAIEEFYVEKKIRAVGVSNFLPHHLDFLMNRVAVRPMVNQIECHVGYVQFDTVDYCKAHDILVEAWAPLARAAVFEDGFVTEIAEAHSVTPAQVCLRFLYQMGILPIPKATAPERIAMNRQFLNFELTDQEMWMLKSVPQIGWTGLHPDRERVLFS